MKIPKLRKLPRKRVFRDVCLFVVMMAMTFMSPLTAFASDVVQGTILAATVFTTVGKAWVIDRLDGTVSTNMQYVAWGTGAGTAAVGDTTLFTEASETRVSGTQSQPAADTAQTVATITANGSKTITNAGVLTASSSGTLIIKGDFTGIALSVNDSITFTITLQQT